MFSKLSSKVNFIAVTLIFLILVFLRETGIFNAYVMGILMLACISIIMTASLNVATGYLGQLVIGHAGFMAIGAYTAALITKAMANAGVLNGSGIENFIRFIIAIIAGGILAAIFGVLVGAPTLRLKGDYLAIATLGFGEIIRVIIQNLKICGGKGLAQGSAGQALIGINRLADFYVVYWIMVLSLAFLFCFARSRYGRVLKAIREDEIAATAVGIRTTYYKILAFSLSAFFAGLAGGIYAHYLGTLAPGTFDFNKSIEYVIMGVFGGLSSFSGSVIAGTVLTVLPEALRTFADYRMLAYSVALILVMIYRPQGLFGRYEFSLTEQLDKYLDLTDKVNAYKAKKAAKKADKTAGKGGER